MRSISSNDIGGYLRGALFGASAKLDSQNVEHSQRQLNYAILSSKLSSNDQIIEYLERLGGDQITHVSHDMLEGLLLTLTNCRDVEALRQWYPELARFPARFRQHFGEHFYYVGSSGGGTLSGSYLSGYQAQTGSQQQSGTAQSSSSRLSDNTYSPRHIETLGDSAWDEGRAAASDEVEGDGEVDTSHAVQMPEETVSLFRKMSTEEATITFQTRRLQPRAGQGEWSVKYLSESLEKVREFQNKNFIGVEQRILEFVLDKEDYDELMHSSVPKFGAKGIKSAVLYHSEGIAAGSSERNVGVPPALLDSFNELIYDIREIDDEHRTG